MEPKTLEQLWDSLNAEDARRSLFAFVRQAWHVVEPETEFVDNWHIKAICDHLEAVSGAGPVTPKDAIRIRQLLINIPPGMMKSLLVCVFWPCWVWTHSPEKSFFFASYAEKLSQRDSLKRQGLLCSEWYQERWPLQFTKQTEAYFENSSKGWMMATGVGGKATGYHPSFIVVDDPSNAQKAESDADRENVTTWWDGTMSSRGVSKGVRRVIVMQRLHMKDLSGHVLEKGGWTHICLPMQYEAPAEMAGKLKPRMERTPIGFQDPRTKDGELLWPKLFPIETVNGMAIDMGIYHAAGQLQQRPSPRGGGMFKREWFTQILQMAPAEHLSLVRYWDKAGTSEGQGARTAGVLMGRMGSGKLLVMDVIAGRWGAVEREAVILATAQADAARWGHVVTWVEQEPGSGGKESAEATVRNLAGYSVSIERVTGSKEYRAEPLATQASIGNVAMLSGKWNSEFVEEIEMFPAGRLKDQVDAASGAANKLIQPTGAFSSASELMTCKTGDFEQPDDFKTEDFTSGENLLE